MLYVMFHWWIYWDLSKVWAGFVNIMLHHSNIFDKFLYLRKFFALFKKSTDLHSVTGETNSNFWDIAEDLAVWRLSNILIKFKHSNQIGHIMKLHLTQSLSLCTKFISTTFSCNGRPLNPTLITFFLRIWSDFTGTGSP